MKDKREFLNSKKTRQCKHDNLEGYLFCQRVVSGHSDRQYGYINHPACFSLPDEKGRRHIVVHRKRCYIGLLSKYITGRTCRTCGKRVATFSDRCYKCRAEKKMEASK